MDMPANTVVLTIHLLIVNGKKQAFLGSKSSQYWVGAKISQMDETKILWFFLMYKGERCVCVCVLSCLSKTPKIRWAGLHVFLSFAISTLQNVFIFIKPNSGRIIMLLWFLLHRLVLPGLQLISNVSPFRHGDGSWLQEAAVAVLPELWGRRFQKSVSALVWLFRIQWSLGPNDVKVNLLMQF